VSNGSAASVTQYPWPRKLVNRSDRVSTLLGTRSCHDWKSVSTAAAS
jgi:hypothetical protein